MLKIIFINSEFRTDGLRCILELDIAGTALSNWTSFVVSRDKVPGFLDSLAVHPGWNSRLSSESTADRPVRKKVVAFAVRLTPVGRLGSYNPSQVLRDPLRGEVRGWNRPRWCLQRRGDILRRDSRQGHQRSFRHPAEDVHEPGRPIRNHGRSIPELRPAEPGVAELAPYIRLHLRVHAGVAVLLLDP